MDVSLFCNELEKNGVDFYVGVPDSFLYAFCDYVSRVVPKERRLTTANEGNAVAVAAGRYFATRKLSLVYLQNSGLGVAYNPLASLADVDVYSVPMVLLIGWRGRPGENDWAQHKLQGATTLSTLEALNVPYAILEDDDAFVCKAVKQAALQAQTERRAVALVAPKGTLSGRKKNDAFDSPYSTSRAEAIETIVSIAPSDAIFCATTGRATRELYYLRERRNETHRRDFLNVGSMGHASSVALGIALSRPERTVVCFDGDAASIMHMGAEAIIGAARVPNLFHIVLNNGAHESVGGQPSVGFDVDLTAIAQACGYATNEHAATTRDELVDAFRSLQKSDRSKFIEARVRVGMDGKLPTLDASHRELIDELMNELNRD